MLLCLVLLLLCIFYEKKEEKDAEINEMKWNEKHVFIWFGTNVVMNELKLKILPPTDDRISLV